MSRLALRAKSLDTAPRPFLKWAGGKRSVVPHLLERFPDRIATYFVPVLGGGALFWALAAHRRFDRAVLCDRNARLVRTYRAVRDQVDDVVERLRDLASRHGPETFHEVRAVPIDEARDDAAV